MSITLREHQQTAIAKAIDSWSRGNTNVVTVLPTGAGKTLVMAEQARLNTEQGIITIIFAHRDVLLGQISDALCLLGVHHTFIASKAAVGDITSENQESHGDSYYVETAKVIVASVDTFRSRQKKGLLDHLLPMVGMWMMDEAHHLLATNKWGQCVEPLVNARGLGVTATPIRSDGKGLGAHADGVFDEIFVGASMGELIQAGYLAPYKIFVPPVKVDVSNVRITGSGDYNQAQLAEATDKSAITGDAVAHYKKLADGKQAITFCVNIAHSEHVAEAFNAAGIPSVALSSKTPMRERQQKIKDFRAGRIKNLVNADLFGEGFDVPSVEICIMLRKTESYSLFKQQFGRALRVLAGKEFGILIDHVGNVPRHCTHGYPHDDPEWSLDRKSKRKAADDDDQKPKGRKCPECGYFYVPDSPLSPVCPDCGHAETQDERMTHEREIREQAGELVEMKVEFVTELLLQRQKIHEPVEKFRERVNHLPSMARAGALNRHVKRQHAHTQLMSAIQSWCSATSKRLGLDVTLTQAEFKRVFGVDVYTATAKLSEREAYELLEKIKNEQG